MQIKGGFGILEDSKIKGTLRRSLLWHRGLDTSSLERIVFPPDRNGVLSWSWMAYSGIKDSNREREDIQSPWSDSTEASSSTKLIADAWEYDTTVDDAMLYSELCNIIHDVAADQGASESRCIVLGKRKEPEQQSEKIHYVLIVRAMQVKNEEGYALYERIGAGYMPGKCILKNAGKVHVQ